MTEIKLTKRYPHSRTEDITDAFMRGYEMGKEQEHRWWSAFCANCKTENNSEIPNNCKTEPQTEVEVIACPIIDDDAWIYEDEPQTVETMSCQECKHFNENAVMYLDQCEFCFKECHYEPKDEPQTESE